MSRIAVVGGKRLCGAVVPSGSKNATLPIIFAAVTVTDLARNVQDVYPPLVLRVGHIKTRPRTLLSATTSLTVPITYLLRHAPTKRSGYPNFRATFIANTLIRALSITMVR